MESELKKTRGRVRRKVFYPMASERSSYPVKIVLNKQRSSSQWRDEELAVGEGSQPEPTDVEQRVETEPILIKDEETAEDVWKTDHQEELRVTGEESGSKPGKPLSFEQRHCDEDFITQPNISPEDSVEHYPNSDCSEEPGTPRLTSTEVFSTEQHRPAEDKDSLDLVMVKDEKEEELDQTMALAGPDQFVMDETDGQLWTSVDPGRDTDPDGHPDFSFHSTEEYSQNISIFPSCSRLPSVPTMTDDPTDVEQREDTEPILIKDEETAEDVWKTDPQEELRVTGEESGSKPGKPPSFEQRHCDEDFITQPNISPKDSVEHYPNSDRPEEPGTLRLASTEVFSTEQHRPAEDKDSLDLVMVKDEKEEELDQTMALAGPDQFVMDETDGQLWTSVDPGRDTDPDGHPDFSFHSTEEYSQNISIFPSHSGLPSIPTMTDDVGPSLHSSIWKPHTNLFSAGSHMTRHVRTLADETRQQMPEGESSERLNSNNEGNSSALQPRQHQYGASSESTVRMSECMTGSNMATTSTFSGYSLSRSSFNMVKRMRTQWRSGGTTERRFSCTF
ncbi:hypothetical protein J4Q44_G00189740 [Coregonus suidteri]|uniref:Uncharacterized protein n=1 Tax=Coregonus suidteri TaxID=861788 RepID=A0AAN8LJP5_9TELE